MYIVLDYDVINLLRRRTKEDENDLGKIKSGPRRYSEKAVKSPFFRNSIWTHNSLSLSLYSEKLVHVP